MLFYIFKYPSKVTTFPFLSIHRNAFALIVALAVINILSSAFGKTTVPISLYHP
jgi:hypothetical protein